MEQKVFIKHIVNDMDESMFQHCVMCGEIITDYRNSLWTGEAPKGWAAGEVYIRNGEPKFFSISVNDDDLVNDCINPFI